MGQYKFYISFDYDRGLPTQGDEWIRYRLLNRHRHIVEQGGADIDGDGLKEVFSGDFLAFYEKYKAKIWKHYPAFRAAAMFDKVVGGKALPLVHSAMAIADLRLRFENVPLNISMLCLSKFNVHSLSNSRNKSGYRAKIGVGFFAYSDLACAYIDAKQAFASAKTAEGKVKALIKAVGPNFKLLTRGKVEMCEGVYFDEALIASAILAKQLNLDAQAVLAPRNRLFLRYKKGTDFSYIDSQGRIFSHAELAREVPEQAHVSLYLRPLIDRELLGMLVFNRANEWMKLGSVTWDRTNRPMFPTDANANLKFIAQGLADYNRSVSAVPMNPTVLAMVGGFYYQLAKGEVRIRLQDELIGGAMGRAKELLQRMRSLDPEYSPPKKCTGFADFPAKDTVEEKSFLEKYGKSIAIGAAVLATGLIAWRLFRGRWGR